MLNNARDALGPALRRVGAVFAATGLPPSAWTAVGLGLAVASAALYAFGAAHALLLGSVLLLASGFFDVVDGQVARIARKESAAGAFADSVTDKGAEAVIYFGILAGGLGTPPTIFAALALSLLASYTRARAESLGVRLGGVGIGERAERLLIVAAGGIAAWAAATPEIMEFALIAVAVVAAVTVGQRIVRTCGALGST